MQIGVKPGEQVFRRRLCAYRAGENSTFAKSRVDRFQSSPVTLQKSALLLGRKGEHGVVHAQRSSDLRSDQLRIWNTGALCQSVAEQANPHAVRVGRFRGAVPREEVVQRDAIVVRKGLLGSFGTRLSGALGSPERWVARSSRVICVSCGLSAKSGKRIGRSGSSRLTFRCTASCASASPVKVFVTEPISNTGCRGHPCRRKRETHRGFHIQ